MIPIHELLSRIRWDPRFSRGSFVIGVHDRFNRQPIRVPLGDIRFPPDEHGAFEFCDAQGTLHHVPLHRVREVWKDGELIWRRPDSKAT